ncbi:hypothetical protein DL769_001507 [Monosporascus sp. CRB-8-3]|nr:hypothetical protein DL769_001507 [Monosporascus sp. CRB-8-3]
MIEGLNVLFVQEKESLGRLGYVSFGYEATADIAPKDGLSVTGKVQLRSVEEDIGCLLDAFDVRSLPEDDKSIYMEAKEYVLYHYRAFYSGTAAKILRRFIGFMAVRCRPGYRNMLERHDPLAMALMARLLVLLKGLDYAWWMNGGGDYEVVERDVRGMRELMPANLRWAMDWPCRVLDGEIVLSRDYRI